MARILNVSDNNYRVVVKNEGTITLDTGNAVGVVRITGSLVVDGDYTQVNVSEMFVEDNIIVLNNGETGAGITEITSGITIDRGTLTNAEFLFNESISHYDPYTDADITGTFVLRTDNGNRSGLQVSTIVRDGTHNIYFDLQNSTTNVLELKNVNPQTYSDLLIDVDPLNPNTATYNYIPNKLFIKNYIQSGLVTPGMADVDKIYKKVSGIEKSRVQTTATDIEFLINSSIRGTVSAIGLTIDNINLYANTIKNNVTDLRLTAFTDQVQIDALLNLKDRATDPVWVVNHTQLVSHSDRTSLAETPGRTGIFFANEIVPDGDELVAKNRALLFSMLF